MGKFTPAVTIPNEALGVSLWAEVSSTDRNGLVIDGVKEGDILEIQEVSGICSFSESSNSVLAGFVGIAAGILEDGTDVITKGRGKETHKAISEQSKDLRENLSKSIKEKHRDGYGKDPRTGDFAKNEGGIIVCMPKAKGPIYASPDNHLKDGAKKQGRKNKFYSEEIKNKNSFFLYNDGKTSNLKAIAKTSGAINILCFDSIFDDNGGSYTVKCVITRKHDKSPHTATVDKLNTQLSNYSLY